MVIRTDKLKTSDDIRKHIEQNNNKPKKKEEKMCKRPPKEKKDKVQKEDPEPVRMCGKGADNC